MGLKDVIRRITGRDEPVRRGARGHRTTPRQREDVTVQIQSPVYAGSGVAAPQNAPGPPPASPQPQAPPTAAPAPAYAPPPAPAPAAPQTQPPHQPPQPQPQAPAPAPAAPSPAAPAGGSSAATEYHAIPSLSSAPVRGVLVALEGELEGDVFCIRAGENKLGRSETCDVVLPSMKISREHATVICEEDMFAIAPLADKNPTLVNDEPTEGSELNDGDVIRMGRTTFRFRTVPPL